HRSAADPCTLKQDEFPPVVSVCMPLRQAPPRTCLQQRIMRPTTRTGATMQRCDTAQCCHTVRVPWFPAVEPPACIYRSRLDADKALPDVSTAPTPHGK